MTVRANKHSIPLICMTWKERLTEAAWIEFYRDDFDDLYLSGDWTEDQINANRTIEETADLLTITIDEGTSGAWASAGGAGYNRAPKAFMELDPTITFPCEIITKITGFTTNDDGANIGGLIIGTYPTYCFGKFRSGNNEPTVGETLFYSDGNIGTLIGYVVTGGSWATNNAFGYLWFESVPGIARWKNNTWIDGTVTGNNFLIAEDDATHLHTYMFGITEYGLGGRHLMLRSNASVFDLDGGSTIPVWLKIAIDAGWNITFWYSTDGENYTQYEDGGAPFSINGNTFHGWGVTTFKVGLFAQNSEGGKGATAVTFKYFLINEWGEIGEWATSEECISFQDVRSPNRVYAGRIKSLSPLKRALDDKTGLYKVADMSMVLANNDRYYSERIAAGILKNQEVYVYHAWTENPEIDRVLLMKMFIEDYSLKGTEFHVKMKDSTQKYFSKKIPESICTVEDYPDIHPDHVGRYMPEVLGECAVGATYEKPGAVQAVYIDTAGPPYIHLASRGELNDVTAVYRADGTVINPANWTFIAGPPSTISVNHADGDGTIYFNAEGYSVPAWDSGAGYIQNLVYIIEYLLNYLMGMPIDIIDQASFDTLATFFDDQGWGDTGFLIIQDRQDAMEVLRQLLFTGEIKGYVAKGGDFVVDIKDTFNYEITSTDSHLFTQTDLLQAPNRQWNLTKAINTVNARYGFIPWQQLWRGADSDYKENFYDADMEEDIEMRGKDYPLPV